MFPGPSTSVERSPVAGKIAVSMKRNAKNAAQRTQHLAPRNLATRIRRPETDSSG